MGNLYRNGKSYGGYRSTSAYATTYTPVNGETTKTNVQDVLYELLCKVNALQAAVTPTTHVCTSLNSFKSYVLGKANVSQFGVLALSSPQSAFGSVVGTGELIGTYFGDENGNFTFVLRCKDDQRTYFGSFSTANNASDWKMYEATASTTDLIS